MRRFIFLFLAAAALTGCAGPVHTLRIHEQVPGNLPTAWARTVRAPETGLPLSINPYPSLSERDVDAAWLEVSPEGNTVIVQFDVPGRSKLAEVTLRLRGQMLAVLVDDKIAATVEVERAILDGRLVFVGHMPEEVTKEVVAALNKLAGRPRDTGDVRLRP
ncbi:MAG: hypothetical protein PCFJNLEI_00084 [Verrucomicrobiae bacterium]|nr:hypothetical protein [Verrucomicrobiae bacterium]